MEKEVCGRCPICNQNTIVTEIMCENCNTIIKGNFNLCKFCHLTNEEKHFVEIFIKNRGNIKEIEKELKISYPTVRKLLDQVIVGLGYNSNLDEGQKNTIEIIKNLEDGKITSKEALNIINKNKGDM